MKTHPHIKTLIQHQKWRRGDGCVRMADPKELGEAIDWAVKVAGLAQKFIEAKPAASGEYYERLVSSIKYGV